MQLIRTNSLKVLPNSKGIYCYLLLFIVVYCSKIAHRVTHMDKGGGKYRSLNLFAYRLIITYISGYLTTLVKCKYQYKSKDKISENNFLL